ncbi:hypothetical protein SUGI_0183660 [Cryptomeria japonica]|uniref:pentatricopeptide repeat-containing protein At4g02750 n=1 Tax=Cryptomeria japonica TaxID=3369 RepID=UPI002408AE31|nr:pentatricopeptide repeat-containing protein At4g02750 [Cryptomeria japonica]GLJ12080.1 hypothetical protein SUGI_0183660 [Cryptomeria japonica]
MTKFCRRNKIWWIFYDVRSLRFGDGCTLFEQLWNRSGRKHLHLPAINPPYKKQFFRCPKYGEDKGELASADSYKDVVSWSKLITSHARNGRLDVARQVFDHMPQRNVVSWTAMLAAYVQNGRIEDARKLFDEMPERNAVSWTTLISGYTQNGRLEDAFQLFDKMPERDVVSWNAMIGGCVRNGRIEEAEKLFNQMPSRDVVSWNSMISGYGLNGKPEDARQLFEKMPERNHVSWTTMIAGYINDGNVDEARDLFGKMPKRNLISWNAMIAAYAQTGRMEEAHDLFEQMPKRNVAAWTLMVTKYAECGQIVKARHLFDVMPKRNVVSWTAMIMGYARNGRIEDARCLFDEMPERDVVSWTSMIVGYSHCGRVEEAHQLFEEIPERNVVSWNAMIAGYEQNGHDKLAVLLFLQMQRTGMKPSQGTFTSTLRACASLASLEQGKQVHEIAIKIGYGNDLVVSNALITMYAKCGNVEEACQTFHKMPEHDLVSWNAIIGGYAQHGKSEKALEMFQQMQLAGVKPDSVTFIGVLSACSHAGLVDLGWHHFDSIIQEGSIIPRMEHYACMVDLLGRSGRLDEAEDFIINMPVEPNASIWGTLLSACRIHGSIEVGNRAAEHLFVMEPKNASTYILVSHMYAAAGRWDDVRNVRKMMKEKGLKRQAGCSWIEGKNSVHSFIAGDRSHPLTERLTGNA